MKTVHTPRILLVEDDFGISKLITIAIKRRYPAWHVDQAMSAEEGLDFWNQQFYDLLITDYNLRGMNGLSLIIWLRHSHPALPTILFTAFDTPQIQKAARTAGVNRYIPKPFIIDELIAIAQSLLPASQAQELGS